MSLSHDELFLATRSATGGDKNAIAGACWRAAKAIFQEADTVPNHAARINYAKQLLIDDGGGQLMKQMVRMVVIVLDKAGPYVDPEITTAINQIIDKVAVAVAAPAPGP